MKSQTGSESSFRHTVYSGHPKLHPCERYCYRDLGGDLREVDMVSTSQSAASWGYTCAGPPEFPPWCRKQVAMAPVGLSLAPCQVEVGTWRTHAPCRVCSSPEEPRASTLLTQELCSSYWRTATRWICRASGNVNGGKIDEFPLVTAHHP